MKHQEFYKKYKMSYPPMISPWSIVLIMAVAAVVVPLFMYRNVRTLSFSLSEYLKQVEYFLFIGVPFGFFLFWVNWREAAKRKKRYCWMGKFEVTSKTSSLLFCYLSLVPGKENKLRVDRRLFNKTNIGDYIIIRRDAFGKVDEVKRVNDVLNRLTRAQ